MKAHVLIKIRTGESQDAVRQMRQIKGVLQATATFGPYDAVATIEGNDLAALGHTVTREIQPIVGVQETLTCLVIDL